MICLTDSNGASMPNKRMVCSHRKYLTRQGSNTSIRLPKGTPLLWRGRGRLSSSSSFRLPQSTPLLWRGWGRLSSPSSFRFPRGTPLLWRGWGRFQYPLSAAHNLPVKRRKHVKLLKTYCIFFAIISIYVTFASIFRNRYLLKVFDQ